MLRSATQSRRPIAVYTPYGEDVLLLDSFQGSEGLSELFNFELRMVSGDPALDPRLILGRNVTFRLDHELESPRWFNGVVSSFSLVDIDDRQAVYHAEVVPWLWFLTTTADCRIFQKKNAVEIIGKIFAEYGFADYETKELRSSYRKRDYCVQYRESDFAFVSRLMEEEGIWYYFRHENGRHTLVLADSVGSYFDIAEAEVSIAQEEELGVVSTGVIHWKHGTQALTSRWAASDFNYNQPRMNLRTTVDSALPALSSLQLEKFDFPGRFGLPDEGRQQVQVRMQGEEARHEWVSGEGVRATFAPGGLFRVVSHPNPAEQGRGYVLRHVKYHAGSVGKYTSGGDGSELPWNTEFEAIPDSVLFRPERTTPPAVVDGPQTAVVVGPPGEEIHTDKDGRIKVQFHWDREGRKNENSSCWVRVSQIHAGAGWGSIDIPRIGEEVVVSFLEGDPDQPVVKGRVYNGAAKVPFGLPGEMTRSGAKSNTHKGSGYNEMSMDDTAGKEQIRTNAQFNMDTTVGNNQTLAVGVDRTASIGNNDSLTIGGDSATSTGNDATEVVKNNENLIVGNNIVIDAGTSMTFKCGMSTIHMNQAGVITISGQNVSSLARASNSIIAPMTEIAGAMMLIQAGAICLDVGGIKHIKSKGNTSIAGSNVNVQGGEVVIKGAPIKLGEAGAPIVSMPAPGTGSASSASTPNSEASDITSGSGGGNPGRPQGEPSRFVQGPDGTSIPVYETDLRDPDSGSSSGGKYGHDAEGPYIKVNKNLPAHQRDEEVQHELDHARKDYEFDRKYNSDGGQLPSEAEITAREKEIEAIERNRQNYPSEEAYQKRLAEERQRLEAIRTGRPQDFDDLSTINGYRQADDIYREMHGKTEQERSEAAQRNRIREEKARAFQLERDERNRQADLESQKRKEQWEKERQESERRYRELMEKLNKH